LRTETEKAINLPGVLTSVVALLAFVQLALEYGPERLSDWLYAHFAFVPARIAFLFDSEAVLRRYDALDALAREAQQQTLLVLDAKWSAIASLVTYALLHANWTHFFVNSLTLVAFGAPVARRLGSLPFLAFFGACAVAGALTHLALHPLDFTPVVGASAAISGTMAAIARFIFTPEWRAGDAFAPSERGGAAQPLPRLAENRQALFFVALWFAINLLLGAFPQAIGAADPVAWEAHMGGFLFGLLSFGAFERMAHWRHREA
jgi:membrane associated rhomboid family serine protease